MALLEGKADLILWDDPGKGQKAQLTITHEAERRSINLPGHLGVGVCFFLSSSASLCTHRNFRL